MCYRKKEKNKDFLEEYPPMGLRSTDDFKHQIAEGTILCLYEPHGTLFPAGRRCRCPGCRCQGRSPRNPPAHTAVTTLYVMYGGLYTRAVNEPRIGFTVPVLEYS